MKALAHTIINSLRGLDKDPQTVEDIQEAYSDLRAAYLSVSASLQARIIEETISAAAKHTGLPWRATGRHPYIGTTVKNGDYVRVRGPVGKGSSWAVEAMKGGELHHKGQTFAEAWDDFMQVTRHKVTVHGVGSPKSRVTARNPREAAETAVWLLKSDTIGVYKVTVYTGRDSVESEHTVTVE